MILAFRERATRKICGGDDIVFGAGLPAGLCAAARTGCYDFSARGTPSRADFYIRNSANLDLENRTNFARTAAAGSGWRLVLRRYIDCLPRMAWAQLRRQRRVPGSCNGSPALGFPRTRHSALYGLPIRSCGRLAALASSPHFQPLAGGERGLRCQYPLDCTAVRHMGGGLFCALKFRLVTTFVSGWFRASGGR